MRNRSSLSAAARLALIVTMAGSVVAAAQESAAEEDPWALLRPLVGRWQAEIDGILGTGTGVREYELILDGKYLVFEHASVRLPQEKSPSGDHHRELSIFSYDRERETIVLRQFTVEGFVNRYTCTMAEESYVCTAEATENGTGLQARLTINFESAYEFQEIFELASPGQELSVYFDNRWTRAPTLPGPWSGAPEPPP